MMKFSLQVFLILFCCFTLLSCGKVNQLAPFSYEDELSNYGNVHSHVKNLDQHLTFNALNNPSQENVKELVDELIDGLTSTREKAKAIHDWIAINIFYDLDRYNMPGIVYRPYFYLEVLRSRLTMCGGYTDLFFVMAKMAGLRVASVLGASANAHIWNAIYDNGRWNHIDVTWDAGSYENGSLTYSYSDNFFYLSDAQISVVESHAQDGGNYYYTESQSPYSEY